MNAEQKYWIDNASYEQLLGRWRFAPSGSEWFIGETGDYYAKVMREKRDADSSASVQASKNVGW